MVLTCLLHVRACASACGGACHHDGQRRGSVKVSLACSGVASNETMIAIAKVSFTTMCPKWPLSILFLS